jgi:HD superfamily phosphohydrolase
MATEKKIFNDPVYGFLEIDRTLLLEIIDHPVFQRLRRIQQLGMSGVVYPGALHTRFHHALGALHLMQDALQVLTNKGVAISEEEKQGAYLAVLLHDIGHGPFSHALEGELVRGVDHEQLSLRLMEYFDQRLHGELALARRIFSGVYPKRFLHQLVSGQLDVDRLDYLQRDSFYTGVSEGVIGSDRIIKMLNVRHNRLVVEEKGIYSVEKFLIARRLMYWQVYLHKTVIGAEKLLLSAWRRARDLALAGERVPASPPLAFFLQQPAPVKPTDAVLDNFVQIDDVDLLSAIKQWMHHSDPVLQHLSRRLMERRLLRAQLQNVPTPHGQLDDLVRRTAEHLAFSQEWAAYLVVHDRVINQAYRRGQEQIEILRKDGHVVDLVRASDQSKLTILDQAVEKFFLGYPKELDQLG